MSGKARTGVGLEARVLRAVGEVGEVAHAGGDWRAHVCEQLRGLTSCTQGVVGELQGWDGKGVPRPTRVVSVGLDESAQRTFLQYLNDPTAADPSLAQLVKIPPQGRALTRRDLVDDGAWYSSPYVSEYRRRARVDDLVVCMLSPTRDGVSLGLGCNRAWGDRRFTARDVRALELFGHAMRGWLPLLTSGLASDRAVVVARPGPVLPALPPRCAQVLGLLVEGKSDKEAARAMGLSVHTVGMHVRRLYRLLGVHSRAQAVRKALDAGGVPGDGTTCVLPR